MNSLNVSVEALPAEAKVAGWTTVIWPYLLELHSNPQKALKAPAAFEASAAVCMATNSSVVNASP